MLLPETTIIDIRLPAYSEVLNESISVSCPADWEAAVRECGPALVYGEGYRRGVADSLIEMSRNVRHGYTALAWDRLNRARVLAGLESGR